MDGAAHSRGVGGLPPPHAPSKAKQSKEMPFWLKPRVVQGRARQTEEGLQTLCVRASLDRPRPESERAIDLGLKFAALRAFTFAVLPREYGAYGAGGWPHAVP